MELTLPNKASEIPRAHHALDRFAAMHGLSGRGVTALHVAVEEHLTNVVSYGYRPGQHGVITLRVSLEQALVRLEIEDDADEFNPLEAPEADTSLPLDEKPVGGLGVVMIRRSIDQLEYRRVNGHNLLVMKKRMV